MSLERHNFFLKIPIFFILSFTFKDIYVKTTIKITNVDALNSLFLEGKKK